MKIQSIKLRHCYHFSDLNVEFNYAKQPITLILGDQSTGKTAIIKNIYQALTWFPARFKDSRTAGVVMLDADIKKECIKSTIEVNVEIPTEIGVFSEHLDTQENNANLCSWTLFKTITANGLGHSKVDTAQLEQLAEMYHKIMREDPLQGLPLIAYYPSDRFVNETNLLTKNNPAVFQNHSAYENVAISYTTFARFFEWLREITDIENAQTSHLLQQLLFNEKQNQLDGRDAHTDGLSQKLLAAHAQMHAPSMEALKTALNIVFPDLSDIFIEYLPKLQLMVTFKDQTVPFFQLSNSMRNWIALVGDVVRRLCLLNPNQLYPCLEGDGILLIDNIDAQLDKDMTQNILNKLHQAFPRIQIIATGTSEDLLEYAQDYQYLKLKQKKLISIDLSTQNNDFDLLFQNLLQHIEPVDHELALEPENLSLDAQSMFEQFQVMTPEQQSDFLQLIHNGERVSIAKI